jgi:hypothetical protein
MAHDSVGSNRCDCSYIKEVQTLKALLFQTREVWILYPCAKQRIQVISSLSFWERNGRRGPLLNLSLALSLGEREFPSFFIQSIEKIYF